MSAFPAIRIEGGLLGPDVLEQLLAAELPGQKPTDFGLEGRRNLTDKIAEVFADARAQWEVFRRRLERLPENDPATSVTRDTWMIPFLSLLGYELCRNPRAYEVDGASFAISHRAGEQEEAPPVHIVGARQEPGRVAATGRPRLAPHSLVQEFLNRSEQLWGIVTNGKTLRLLRDSTYIRRQAYIEFNLAQILEEQRFNDFVVLYRLLHRTRLPRSVTDASDCWLEKYYRHSLEQGGRVRERLREGVEKCLTQLANGFLAHPANGELRQRILAPAKTANHLSPEELYRQLLRLVYRFLFLLVSEDRGLISADPIYREHYGVGRLRRYLDRRSAYTDHDDLWCSLKVLWKVLADEQLASMLGAAPLNGELFEPLDLDAYALRNRDLLEAFWHLAYYRDTPNSPPRRVNYAALDVEELGSVYESLLDYHPQIDASGSVPRFELAYGSERKATGSYYTPPELVAELVRSALEPVLKERLSQAKAREEQERAILSLRVLDPACGSGHFLLAAARRLGKELARIRTGEEEPAPERVREAVREVVSHCIYGVDKNPLAVELCRVALWLEAHCAGKPLTFLDHRIRCGDSLVGVVDLGVLEQGIPDEAFAAASADDRTAASLLKKRNRAERRARESGQERLPFDPQAILPDLAHQEAAIEAIPDDSPELVRHKKQRYASHQHDPERRKLLEACNLWAAAFFQRLVDPCAPYAITTDVVLDHLESIASSQAVAQAEALALQHRFFHWPLEFAEVFAEGGFDVVIGNPPWGRIKLQDQEFFASRDAAVANAPTAARRKQLIAELPTKKPELWQAYCEALHAAESQSCFLRGSGFFPLTGRGDINTYSVFSERMRALLKPGGRMGVIVPTGIATDDTNKHFFGEVVIKGELVNLYDFENSKRLFPAIAVINRFSLLTLRKADDRQRHATRDAAPAEFAFFLHEAADLADPERRFTLVPEDFRLLNPNTKTAPIFRSRRDAELTKHIYRRVPVLVDEAKGEAGNPWGVEFLAMLHMANDSDLFRTREELEDNGFHLEGNVFVKGQERFLPLYEAKMVHQFDHRFGDYSMQPADSKTVRNVHLPEVPLERLLAANYCVQPRYWVPEEEVEARLRAKHWDRGWLLGWRDITNTTTNQRTVMAAVVPRVGVGNKIPLIVSRRPSPHHPLLVAVLCSLPLDYAARQKLGGTTLNFFIFEQLPVLPPSAFEQPLPFRWESAHSHQSPLATRHLPPTIADFIRPRVLELTYTAWDLKPFAQDLGYDGPPFPYDPERRFWLRAELDALFFYLYLGTAEEWEAQATPDLKALFPTPRDAVAYILEQFPIVRRKDEERFGEYRTKRVILEIYDAMQAAARSKSRYVACGDTQVR